MRIHLKIDSTNHTIPFDHQPLLVGTIHKWLGLNNEHGEVSLYSFSRIEGGRAMKAGLKFEPYFFGAYGMGAGVYWAGQKEKYGVLWLWLIVSLTVIALMIEFRTRILIALAVAVTLFFTIKMQHSAQSVWQPIPRYLGKISYSLFLIHFPILLLTNATFAALGLTSPVAGGIAMLTTWAASLLMADLFYRSVEIPSAKLFRSANKRN